eukprot:TRINITY_DN87951_c0_g1_i1.p1 TRINITY_DN87951_c0_g1~~TRINITY_DN87951_c0_g1_i1.p1  ORF type:complete len:580 (+),score=108.48 TRINITY_DN87951_c0_g1_i1:117-1742(+)
MEESLRCSYFGILRIQSSLQLANGTIHTSEFGIDLPEGDASSNKVQPMMPEVCSPTGLVSSRSAKDGIEDEIPVCKLEAEGIPSNECDQEQQAADEEACTDIEVEGILSQGTRRTSSSHATNRSRNISTFHQNLRVADGLRFKDNSCASVVKHRWFDNICAGFIISSSMLIGVEVEVKTASSEWIFDSVGLAYTVFFFIELVLRIAARGQMFFVGLDRAWNYFDMVCVGSSLIEIVVNAVLGSQGADSSVLLIVRAMRVIRVARIIRVIRLLSKLRMLVFTLLGALRMLGWALLLLTLIMYMFAVTFTEASKPVIMALEGDLSEERVLLERHFRSLWTTMLTLFESIAGGVSWGEPLSALAGLSPLYVFMFLLYICLVILAMLNVLTGLCCDYAIQNAVSDRDDAIRAQLKDKAKWQQQFESMFKAIDSDESGEVSGEELGECLLDEEFQAYLAHLNVSVDDAFDLLELFDKDGTGTISIDEFVTGCMRVKGQAKTIDMMKIMRGVDRLHEEVLGVMQLFVSNAKRRLRATEYIVGRHAST